MAKEKKNSQAELSLTAIHDDITFSKTDVWVWVKLPPTQYEFLDDKSRLIMATELDSALNNLVTSDEKNVECHMIVSSRAFDAVDWIRKLDAVAETHRPNPYNKDFLYNMYSHVEDQDFREKIVLLGINVGKRVNFSTTKSLTPTTFEKVINLVSAAPVSDYISTKELEYWQGKARSISLSLQKSRVGALPAEAADIAYAVRKNFFPAMPSPTTKELEVGVENVWGEGEVSSLVDAQIENHPKFLKITQDIGGKSVTGYRATLCFSKFPSVMDFPSWNPWVHVASLLPFPVDFSLRFFLEPARKVRKEVDKKLKEAEDQANNMESAGGSASIEIVEHIISGKELDYKLKQDTTPWVFGRYRITVESDTEIGLRERVQEVIEHYKSIELVVTWPTGDQFSLLKESLPNDKVRVLSYFQRQELSIISTGIPAGTGTAGDKIVVDDGHQKGWIGQYLGYTTGTIREPVFNALHSTIDNDNAGGVVITGGPGGGKTFATLTMTYQMALEGVWSIYIDPKNDASRLATLPGMKNRTNVVDLQNGSEGILDPFSIGPDHGSQIQLAIETIVLIMGGIENISPAQNLALTDAVKVVGSYPAPSLGNVVDYLKEGATEGGRSLGATLDVIRQLPYANLCFARNKGLTLRAEDGLTIVTLLGLDLPGADTASNEYTKGNQLAVAVMYLLTSFTRQLMLNSDKSHPKAIIIDEAWAITSTKQGQALVKQVARMGRSHNTGIILVSQNAGDFLGGTVLNSVSTKFAFKSDNSEEIDNVLRLYRLELNDTNRSELRGLNTGECLMMDWSGRVARVKVDNWASDQNRAYESNPTARKNQ